MALLSTWAPVVTRFIEPIMHRSHLDRCAQARLDLSGSPQSNHLPPTPPLIGFLQLHFLPPHTLRFTGVLNGVEVSAATRSRRFGLKWRVAVAPSSATAAFLDASNTSCASVTPYTAECVLQEPSNSFMRQLITCVTLETAGYRLIFRASSSLL